MYERSPKFCYGSHPINKILTKVASSFWICAKAVRRFTCIWNTYTLPNMVDCPCWHNVGNSWQLWEIQVTMEASSHGLDDCSRRASGMVALMDKFQTFIGLKLSVMILVSQSSCLLQSKESTLKLMTASMQHISLFGVWCTEMINVQEIFRISKRRGTGQVWPTSIA